MINFIILVLLFVVLIDIDLFTFYKDLTLCNYIIDILYLSLYKILTLVSRLILFFALIEFVLNFNLLMLIRDLNMEKIYWYIFYF